MEEYQEFQAVMFSRLWMLLGGGKVSSLGMLSTGRATAHLDVILTKALMISDHAIHELGCAAALKRNGVDVTYLNIGSIYSKGGGSGYERRIGIDEGEVQIRYLSSEMPHLGRRILKRRNTVPESVLTDDYDVVITTPQLPWYVGNYLGKRNSIPLILRVPTLKAAKLQDHIAFGRYHEIFVFVPSVLHNSLQTGLSESIVALDHVTRNFIGKIMLSDSRLVYPTYARIGNEETEEDACRMEQTINEVIDGRDEYVFSITRSARRGGARAFETHILRVLNNVCLENKDIRTVVIGTDRNEARVALGTDSIAENLEFLGSIYSDRLLERLYRNCRMVICPVMTRSISNRLLEAYYYSKPILTNTISTLIHTEIEDEKNAVVSNIYAGYGRIVRNLLRNDAKLDDLSKGAERLYRDIFSSQTCGTKMKNVITNAIS